MANKRVFVAFAIEDLTQKILFCGQAKNERSPYEFVDMSVKKAWDSEWKTKCRTRIKGCDGVIVLVSPKLKNADGALWEIKCAKEEGKKMLGIYIDGGSYLSKPESMSNIICKQWSWETMQDFVKSL